MRKVRNAGCGFVGSSGVGPQGKSLLLTAAVLAGISGMTRPVLAGNEAWSVSPNSNLFSGINWTASSTAPGAANSTINGGDSLFFGTSNRTSLNNDEAIDFAPGGITFNSGASAFSIIGNELDLSSSSITDNALAVQTISTPILLNSTPTFSVTTGGGLVLSGAITGSGSFTKTGNGTLTLAGQFIYDPNNPFATAYSGTNTISAGRVISLNSATGLGNGSTNNIATGATLELRNTTGSNILQAPTTFAGTGTIQKTGYGDFVFGGNGPNVNVSMGAGALIDVQAGQLIGSSSNQGKWTNNQASMNIAAGASFEGDEAPVFIDSLTGAGTFLGGYGGATVTTIGVANGSGTFTGKIKDSRDGGGILSLTKTGTGTEILTNENTFSGNTVVTGGTLELDNNLALEQSVLNIPAVGTGSIVWGAGVTSTSIILGGIAGSTNFALQRGASPASLTLTGGTANLSSVFTGALVGGTTLTKAGGGIQTLSGANTYTGSTTILEGGLSLDYNANANGGSPIIPSTSSLTLGGTTGFVKTTVAQGYPSLQVQGSSTGPVTQTFNGLTLNVGSSQIASRGLNGNTTTLALGAITHNPGSSVVFSNLNDGVAGSQGIITTTATANATTGLLGGWAAINTTPANSANLQMPNAYATISGGTVVPYTNYTAGQIFTDTNNNTSPTSSAALAPFTGGANQNFKFILTNTGGSPSDASLYDTPNGVTTDVNTILLDSSSTSRLRLFIGDINSPSTATLRFGVDGGVFMAAASNTRTSLGFGGANHGYITAGGPNNNTAGTLTFQLNNRIDINDSIVDNGTGAVTVVYNTYANQTPTINTPNNYSGGTFINSGRIQLKTDGAFGTGPVTVSSMAQIYFGNGAENYNYSNNFFINGNAGNNGYFFDTPSALRFDSSTNLTGNIVLLGDSTIRGGSGISTLSGQISGNYNLYINQNTNGGGPGNVTLSNPNNSWGGDTTLQGGSLVLTAAGALPAGTNLTIFNSGVLTATALPVGKALSVGTLDFFGSMGKIDLNNNALIVHSGTLAAVNGLVQLGFNNGLSNGSAGIVSASAAGDSSHLTALGVITNNNGSGTPLYGAGGAIATTFGGAAPVLGDVLVKYTYFGDANLSGKVDSSDYSRIDNGYLSHATGWYNGDFNYDGVVDGSDYTLIDNAFNTQGAQIASIVATPTAQIAGGIGGSAVPEPTTLGLLGIGAAGLLGRRRRR